jgi:hypothetical protein
MFLKIIKKIGNVNIWVSCILSTIFSITISFIFFTNFFIIISFYLIQFSLLGIILKCNLLVIDEKTNNFKRS